MKNIGDTPNTSPKKSIARQGAVNFFLLTLAVSLFFVTATVISKDTPPTSVAYLSLPSPSVDSLELLPPTAAGMTNRAVSFPLQAQPIFSEQLDDGDGWMGFSHDLIKLLTAVAWIVYGLAFLICKSKPDKGESGKALQP